jgi:hypothetical protein
MVVATASTRASIVEELTARSLDVVELQRSGDLLLLDAAETLSTFMIDDKPDARKFREQMCRLIEGSSRGRTTRTIRIFGQMVDVLWQDGKRDAAIRLEVLWNRLARSEAFSLLCGYAIGSFYKDAGFEHICRQHSHLVSTDGARNDWIARACPRCHSNRAVPKVRADATAFTCRACGYDWTVKRMPPAAEAADILRRSRRKAAEPVVVDAAAGGVQMMHGPDASARSGG